MCIISGVLKNLPVCIEKLHRFLKQCIKKMYVLIKKIVVLPIQINLDPHKIKIKSET